MLRSHHPYMLVVHSVQFGPRNHPVRPVAARKLGSQRANVMDDRGVSVVACSPSGWEVTMCRVIVQIIVDEAVWVGKIERVVHRSNSIFDRYAARL